MLTKRWSRRAKAEAKREVSCIGIVAVAWRSTLAEILWPEAHVYNRNLAGRRTHSDSGFPSDGDDRTGLALEARLLKPATVTKLCLDGFDIVEYQRVMLEVVSHDPLGWHTKFKALRPDLQGKQKVLMFGKGWVVS